MPLRRKVFLLSTILLVLAHGPGPLKADEPSLYEYILTELDGKETTLEAFKGRILVLEFFATWCPPCRKDLPQIAGLQENYPPEKIAFLAVSADGASDTVRSLPGFLKETGLKIPVLVGGGLFVDKYAGVDKRGAREIVLPQTYVFDGNGEMSLRLVGEHKSKAKSLTETLERLMKASAS
ncbi:MAG: TlpA family protein disulfide reductase [Acidobacteria bacterium]|nr:TlpA family protein disulfide reductase [Acidobacteriota bacterium]MCI0567923.1 TlpA family protein disulfide reductase [Acidobacteriota bacterium]